MREVIELAQQGKLALTPVREEPKHRANDVMYSLDQGRITGRVVLTDADWWLSMTR